MTRSRFGLLVASSIALTARPAFAGGIVKTMPPQPQGTLSLHWSVEFDPSDAVLGTSGPATAALTIDRSGAWTYSGSFGPQPKLATPYAITVAIGAKTSVPGAQIFAFSKSLTLTAAGAGWQKVGTDPLLAAFVQGIAKSGYAWCTAARSHAMLASGAPPVDGSAAVSAEIAAALSAPIAVTF